MKNKFFSFILLLFITFIPFYSNGCEKKYYGDGIVQDYPYIPTNYSSYYSSNYTEMYFKNLDDNFGYNVKGSCGYIAIGMLLSYYDAFLSDDFISEQYDAHTNLGMPLSENSLSITSPGVYYYYTNLFESILNYDYLNNYINNSYYYNNYFQYYLLHTYNSYYKMDQTMPCSLNSTEVMEILSDYIDSNHAISDYVDVVHISPNNLLQDVISCVNNGIPVLVLATRQWGNNPSDSFNHAAICYDYFDGKLIFHWGVNDLTYVDDYNNSITIDDAFYLNSTLSHTCNDNYYYNNENYCSCAFCNSPYHNHSYSYGNYNSNNHFLVCNTSTFEQPHNFSYFDWNQYSHRTLCGCGFNQLQAHAISSNATGLTRCLFCNRLIDLGTGIGIVNNYVIIELNDEIDLESNTNYDYLIDIASLVYYYLFKEDSDNEKI